MAIEIEDIKKALRSGKYSEMQSNIDMIQTINLV